MKFDNLKTKDGNINITVENGIITEIEKAENESSTLYVIPAMADMHVHLREPGQTHKEDVHTGTAAALAGGFTDIACMPNTTPPIDNARTMHLIVKKAENTGVRVHPIVSVTKGMKGIEVCNYKRLKEAGAVAISEDGLTVGTKQIMAEAISNAYGLGLPIIAHCEPEIDIVEREIRLAREMKAAVHIAHVSRKKSVDLIRIAKRKGIKVTCETCPHYMLLTEKDFVDANQKMKPPLRTEVDRLAVIDALYDGTIDCIVTDHAPHTESEKSSVATAPNGSIGLETALSAVITAIGFDFDIIEKLMVVRPREILGLPVPEIKVGNRAEFVIFDPAEKWVVDPENFKSKSKNSAFNGMELTGKIKYVISGDMKINLK
ncbi:MAG: dihydroorotase [Ruminococcus sp.]|jgi:dihydroorotase|nr:dihydroorotase [Ruminococcus sp.]